MSKFKEIKGMHGYIKVVPRLNEEDIITSSDKEMDFRAKEAVKAAISKAETCKKPIAKYDVVTKKAYLQYPDGSIINVWEKANGFIFCRSKWIR